MGRNALQLVCQYNQALANHHVLSPVPMSPRLLGSMGTEGSASVLEFLNLRGST